MTRNFEAHDVPLAASVFGQFEITQMLVRCTTGEELEPPCDGCSPGAFRFLRRTGFGWYDTGQARSRKLGVRS